MGGIPINSMHVAMISFGYEEYRRREPKSAGYYMELLRSMHRLNLVGVEYDDASLGDLLVLFATSVAACSGFNLGHEDLATAGLAAQRRRYATFDKSKFTAFFEVVPEAINTEST